MCLILILDLICVIGAGAGFVEYGTTYSDYSTLMWVALVYLALRIIIGLVRLAIVDEIAEAFFWSSFDGDFFDGFDAFDSFDGFD